MIAMATWIAIVSQAAAAAVSPPATPPAEIVAPGVELLRGAILPGRGPDGNTVVFDAPEGLVVVDTGRHNWHSDAILALARERKRPVVAIVNTHWHLDHSSGNGRLKAAFPDAPVYTTNAVDRVLAEGGFLARNLESAQAMLEDPKLSDTEKEEVRIFMATMAESHVLRPDMVVDANGERKIGGRNFDVHVTDGAVTDADLWLYDAASGVAVLGDLVTFPAPVLRDSLPGAVARGAGRGPGRALQAGDPGPWRTHGPRAIRRLARRIQRIHGLCRKPGRRRPVCGRLGDRHRGVHRRG